MYSLGDVVRAVLGIKTTQIVSCPLIPKRIPGVTAAGYTAVDCVGTVMELAVPKRGVIISAMFLDLSDQGKQYDLEIFNGSINVLGDNNTWSPSDADMLKFVTEINFFAFDDQINSQTSEVKNIGKAYTSRSGLFYIQTLDRGGATIAAGAVPRLQLQIQSFDPDFKES